MQAQPEALLGYGKAPSRFEPLLFAPVPQYKPIAPWQGLGRRAWNAGQQFQPFFGKQEAFSIMKQLNHKIVAKYFTGIWTS